MNFNVPLANIKAYAKTTKQFYYDKTLKSIQKFIE